MLYDSKYLDMLQLVAKADDAYYCNDDPIMSDEDYDRLFRELKDYEARNPTAVCPNSPTQRVGGTPLTTLSPVCHEPPMLSLGNVFTQEELKEWMSDVLKEIGDKTVFTMEVKYDGVAISLLYLDGILTTASTRGLS